MDQLKDFGLLKESIEKFNVSADMSRDNNDMNKAVKRLLSCLQSFCKRHIQTNDSPSSLSPHLWHQMSDQFINCLSKLETIVLFDNSFAETSVLSGLAIALLLIIRVSDVQKAIHLLFKLFCKQSVVSIAFNDYKVDNNLSHLLDSCQTHNDLTKVSLLTAILNCSHFANYLIEFESKVFIQFHCHIIKLCSQRLIHQFHVFRLFQHWFRVFQIHYKVLAIKEPNILDDKTIVTNSLVEIDNNWEHPINGVKDCIKIIYTLILETFVAFKKCVDNNDHLKAYHLIDEELIKTSQLSLTSKAKYRKLTILTQFVGWKRVLQMNANLSSQMLKYLSINSLSTSIIELYKAIVMSMKNESNQDIVNNWSHNWLPYVCDALKTTNKVIRMNMIAHVLPFTVKNIDNSIELIFENIDHSKIAEVAVIRSAIDNNICIAFKPSFVWFQQILCNSEDSVREEGLSLLLDEKYITDRSKVMQLFKLFVSTNLNVDNPSFRQKIISKIEHFLYKLFASLADKLHLYGCYNASDFKTYQFLNEYIVIITSNIISGASFQRRTTCLLLLDSFIALKDKHNLNFDESLDFDLIYLELIMSVIDKDDKVRNTATNLLIKFNHNYNKSIDYNFNTIAEIALNFVNSPRHQESHSGGLLFKYIINCFECLIINDQKISNEMDLIDLFVICGRNQLTKASQDMMYASKNSPIHGFILALNNCLTCDGLLQFCQQNRFKDIINKSIVLCFDCIDLMLSQLSNQNVESSPSFQEMCESLEAIINEQIDANVCIGDISTSNDFQLLLSMCWLNLKECSFLLNNLVELNHNCKHTLIEDDVIRKIGIKLISILTKCRHKGVIEATCIALTRYTTSLIKTKSTNAENIHILQQLLDDCLNCITKSAINSSVTRRSAGVGLTIQAILIGESEAYTQGSKLDSCLFTQAFDKLIEMANSMLPQVVDPNNDLPQTYALHILRTIINSSCVFRVSPSASIESVLPVCIKGFSSDIWPIRNASLQLFGTCCSRMLGQPKISDVDHTMPNGSTITYIELFARYPSLLSVFKQQFEQSFEKINNGLMCPELVPILALFASLSPISFGDFYTDKQIVNLLISLLSNKMWKIRMLSAKSLSCFLPINQLQQLLFELLSQQHLNCNSIHGLMLSVNHLIELKLQTKANDWQTIKHEFGLIFNKLIQLNSKCFVLTDVYNEIFKGNCLQIDFCGQELVDSSKEYEFESNECLIDLLNKINSNVMFTKSNDIRIMAAKHLNHKLDELLKDGKWFNLVDCSDVLLRITQIVLIILEDEDRDVRTEAEIIASKLIYSGKTFKPNDHHLSYNIAIDNLLMWFTENALISDEKKVYFLMNRLESVVSMSDLNASRVQQMHILFEREEKNVFAEPIFVLFKINDCLKRVIGSKSIPIHKISLKRLANECLYCLQNKSIFEMKSLVSFSIWKLPKLLLCITSLYLRIETIFESLSIDLLNQSLNELQLSDNCLENLNDIISAKEVETIQETYRFLSSNFRFLMHIKGNSLPGYSLINFEL